jgi:hypothetical protein
VEEFGTTGGAERIEAFRKSLLQLMQGRHRVNDRFEDRVRCRNAKKPSPVPVGLGRALERLWIALHG